jgi:hypothetical protein
MTSATPPATGGQLTAAPAVAAGIFDADDAEMQFESKKRTRLI